MSKEKRYRLKEEVLKYFNPRLHDFVLTLEKWQLAHNLSEITIEALEEVKPKRVELEFRLLESCPTKTTFGLCKKDGDSFYGKEVNACEFMLNECGGSIESLNELVYNYIDSVGKYEGRFFTDWLKEQNK